MNRQAAQRFARWPELPQADFLAPEGYTAVYETNATTRHGEHGNALLSRWPVVSHQPPGHLRPPLRAARAAARGSTSRASRCMPSWCTWASSRAAGCGRSRSLREFIDREVPPDEAVVVAGDFNDWGARMRYAMNAMGLRDTSDLRGAAHADLPVAPAGGAARLHLRAQAGAAGCSVPRGPIWARMSDHLPLVPISRYPIDSAVRDPAALNVWRLFAGTIPAMLRKTDVDTPPDRNDDDEGTPVSVKIRERMPRRASASTPTTTSPSSSSPASWKRCSTRSRSR
jgi:endonuclease/exonuclease/phosphatase family metal-dependent hydrolase